MKGPNGVAGETPSKSHSSYPLFLYLLVRQLLLSSLIIPGIK